MDSNIMTECFHGKLDRRSAEERLTVLAKPGSFLLRESDRRTGSFVLSFLGKTGINHFRINNVYGSYFIGGKQFDSLADLVHCYSSNCELLTNERLVYPIPPPEPVSAKERLFISILPYNKFVNSDELSFQKGELFTLQNDLGDGWLWCRAVKTGQSGIVSSQLVEELIGDIDPNEVFPWFHGHISKNDAVRKLADAGPGSFLIRPSDNSPGNYTLFFHVGENVQRFLIVKDGENRYTMGGKSYESLGQIIEMYQKEQIIEGHRLQYPVVTTMPRAAQLSETTLSTSMRALMVRDRAQDVYRTVKLSRTKLQSGEFKGWLSLKKADLQKKWKNYFFVLRSRDRHLYYYEKPQQTKPKGLIDLSCSYVYKVHESLFDWPHCLLLVERSLPCFANHFYIRIDGHRREFNRWLRSIKRFSSGGQSRRRIPEEGIESHCRTIAATSEENCINSYEVNRALYLSFIEAHSIKMSQPLLIVSYNQDIKIGKVAVKSAPSTSFQDDGYFALDDLPGDVRSLTVSIHPQTKKTFKEPNDSAHFTIDLDGVRSVSDQVDQWFEFRSQQALDIVGQIRIKMMYSTEIVMNRAQYVALEDLLCDPSVELLTLMERVCHRDHSSLAKALSNIFISRGISVQILKTMIELEGSKEHETSTLFRTSSLTTALIESYMRATCQDVLIKCLRNPVKRLLDDKISCELNPSKLESHNMSQKACENLQNLLDLLDEFVSNIYDSVAFYPRQIRYLFATLQRVVVGRWPNESFARTRVVSGFLFLRLICPTILSPKQFDLVNETPSENAIRNLTLITKCLQNLANLADTSKESWMEVVNPFILKNKIGMVKFIDELCNVELIDPAQIDKPDVANDIHNNGPSDCNLWANDHEADALEPAQDLAMVQNICEGYRDELENLAKSSNVARRLASVLTILAQLKQFYKNLRKVGASGVNQSKTN